MITKIFITMAATILALDAACSNDADSAEQRGPGRDGRYKIGDCYSRDGVTGIVYKITDDGKHGMIVSLDEAQFAWCTEPISLGTMDHWDGQKNMQTIRSVEGWETKFPAFKWCSDRGKGWYLPARLELADLYAGFNGGASGTNAASRAYFNECLSKCCGTVLSEVFYWSSSGHNYNAYNVHFSYGYNDYYYKTGTHRVRAVRAF